MNRKEYWESRYPEYWKARLAETSQHSQRSTVVPGDAPLPGEEALFAGLDLLGAAPGLRWLDIGVGTGRSLPYILQLGPSRVIAADISRAMLDLCRIEFDGEGIEFLEAEAENLGLDSGSIDRAICYGTFDALYQDRAIIEFARVLAPQGRLLLTGKNNDYLDDDEMALAAEVGARRKGHPNYFTDVERLIELARSKGLDLTAERYFERRGDSGKIDFVIPRPRLFYEYMFVFTRSSRHPDNAGPEKISEVQSRTFARSPLGSQHGEG
jgi:SAM-dependent methyltransferase